MYKVSIILVFFLMWSRWTFGADADPVPIEIGDPLPYGQAPIDYFEAETSNAVGRLQPQIESGKLKFKAEPTLGYLPSVLKALEISPASQMLVFSKTALNPKLVSPQTPRAVFFNEDTYVGYVPGAAALEIAAVDPVKGWMFYTLTQPEYSAEKDRPTIQRESQCLACHAGQSTLRIPGGLVRGFVPDDKGNPLSGYSRITHETPFEKRFGGWYVTGSHGKMTHRGNILESKTGPAAKLMPSPNNLNDLAGVFDASQYPSTKSDITAQMLLHHQIHGQNLLIRVGYESRFGKRSDAEDQLIRYLLFRDEAPLAEPIQGSTKFADWFQNRGRKDSQGRSLRDWNLETRLMKYRLSDLIESELFDNLPGDVKKRIYQKLWEGLSAENPVEPFDHLPEEERQAILEITSELKDDLPANWRQLRNR